MDFQARQQQALAILDQTMAAYYAHGCRKYRLPSWESLGGR